MGTPAFAVPALDALAGAAHAIAAVVAQPDRPAGRDQAVREPATKGWARARGVPVLQPEKVRDGRLAADLAALRPEVVVVAAYGRILGKDLLDLAPWGAVNVHASLLPRYRGAAPIQWAVARGEVETGVSIMQMDEGLDTGDVLLQRALAIEPEETAEALAPRLAALGGEALVEALALLQRGALAPVKQDGARATLAPILRREDGRIDWTLPAGEIRDRLRAFTPWPGAWTTLDGKVVKVLEAAVAPLPSPSARPERSAREASATSRDEVPGSPGAALRVPGGLSVACGGPGALLVRRLQPEGKSAQEALAFLNGLRSESVTFGT